MKNKILAVVEFNKGEAFVLKKDLDLKYTRYDDIIIGTDGVFCDCYCYERPGPNWKAFGGRKFDITLVNGEIIHCNGQWWCGGTEKAEKIIGKKITPVTACSIDKLKRCYVFSGYSGIEPAIYKFRKKYKGKVYGYWEYDALLKSKKS